MFQEEGITDLLHASNTGIIGCRNIKDVISDLQAQIAANQQGIRLLTDLVAEYSLDVVQAYMMYIQDNAEVNVRNMLYEFSLAQGLAEVDTVRAEDKMDDGSEIHLAITIDRRNKSAVFDFEGTGIEMYGNCNAPPAVTYSAIIYCLRCLVGSDIPLNQGCLNPVTIRVPRGTFLNPSDTAAVVGGNVLTSQRVVDVILKAFKAAACSQGCMNNLTFGDDTFGYYETICGGAGAGPHWHGRSAIHTHMTNTRITDPEILERRYPVILRTFHLRSGSGGKGKYNGGEGVIREIEFRKKQTMSILSERRVYNVPGIEGGGDGKSGRNVVKYGADGRCVNLGGKNTITLQHGDKVIIETPGGGAYGSAI